jgi:hypothetical protein
MTSSNFTQRMFRSLIAISERDPALFHIDEIDGRVRVQGPCCGASYPQGHWITRFSRDLYSGLFERVSPPSATPGGARTLH